MSTWDERVAAEIVRRGRGETWCNSDRRHFRAGAAWQREQLFTDETIERAAMAILLRSYPSCTPDEARWFAGASGVDDARNDARTALTAATGDQE